MTAARMRDPERLSAWILAGLAAMEGLWVVLNFVHSPTGFLNYTGFAPSKGGTFAGWLLAAAVTALFVWWSARLPSVRANLLRPSFLKLLGLAVAVAAGLLEEMIFRKALMDHLLGQGIGPDEPKMWPFSHAAARPGAIDGCYRVNSYRTVRAPASRCLGPLATDAGSCLTADVPFFLFGIRALAPLRVQRHISLAFCGT